MQVVIIYCYISYSYLQIYQWECSAEPVTLDLVEQFFRVFDNPRLNLEQVYLTNYLNLITVEIKKTLFVFGPKHYDFYFLDQDRKICNFYGSTEMSDVTFAVFRSVDDLLEQMDEKEKVIL